MEKEKVADRLIGFFTAGVPLVLTDMGGTWILEHQSSNTSTSNTDPSDSTPVSHVMNQTEMTAMLRRMQDHVGATDSDSDDTSEPESEEDEDYVPPVRGAQSDDGTRPDITPTPIGITDDACAEQRPAIVARSCSFTNNGVTNIYVRPEDKSG
jgi:hypothetical protein